jgi:zinc protease
MKTRLFAIAALVGMMSATGLRASEAESFVVRGLQVIFKQNTASDIVAAGMYFRGGSTMLTREHAGIEKLALTVAAKATEHYPKEQLNKALESMNTQIGVSATMDYSSLDLLCVKQNFEKSWDIFADVLRAPLFEAQDVELERQKMLSRIKQMKDDPDSYLNNLCTSVFYLDHPYAVDVNGTEDAVSAFAAADLKNYLNGRLMTSHMLLVVVGNTTRADVERMVQKSFGTLPQGTYTPTRPPAVQHQQPSLKMVQRDLPTNYIRGMFPAPAFGSTESYAMRIAGSVLRDRLFEEVRTKRGLSYAPSGGTGNFFSNYGFVYVTAVHPDTTVMVMIAELKRLKQEKLSNKQLRDKINVFITGYYLQNESNQSQASTLARYELSGEGCKQADRLVEHLKKVTPDDILNVCKKYVGNLQFVLLGNPASLQVRAFMF